MASNNVLGAANINEMKIIFQKGIKIAQRHGIDLLPDKENKSVGDCLFQALIDNVNNRNCFSEKMNMPVQFYREKFATELHQEFQNSPFFPGKDHQQRWDNAWEKQKKQGKWNVDEFNVSDIMPAGMGHCMKKNILVFNVKKTAYEPVHVFRENFFRSHISPTTEEPILIVYNGCHYESLLPKTKNEQTKCIQLVNEFLVGSYDKTAYGFSEKGKKITQNNPIKSKKNNPIKKTPKHQLKKVCQSNKALLRKKNPYLNSPQKILKQKKLLL